MLAGMAGGYMCPGGNKSTQVLRDVLDWESFGMQLGRDAKQEEALKLPQQPSRRQPWILAALRSSTKGLRTPGAAVRALEQVNKTLDSMQPGLEQSHLLWMLKHVDA